MAKSNPTLRELEQLSRWACVAFAARCASRVQSLFSKYWPDASLEDADAVHAAIALAEYFAARADDVTRADAVRAAKAVAIQANTNALTAKANANTNPAGNVANAAAYAAKAAESAVCPSADNANVVSAAANAANAATRAASAPIATELPDNNYDPNSVRAVRAVRAIQAVQARAKAEAATNASNIYAATRHDFEFLLELANDEENKWNDDSPVNVNVLGPLWPEDLSEWAIRFAA